MLLIVSFYWLVLCYMWLKNIAPRKPTSIGGRNVGCLIWNLLGIATQQHEQQKEQHDYLSLSLIAVHQSLLKRWSKAAMSIRRNFPEGGNVDILLIVFRVLTLQCKLTFTKRFALSALQRKCPMGARAPFASFLKSSSGAVYESAIPLWQRCSLHSAIRYSICWIVA